MSRLDIHIELDNDAFAGDDCTHEIARILRELADRIEPLNRLYLEGNEPAPRDINGNVVGTVSFEIDETEPDEPDDYEAERQAVVARVNQLGDHRIIRLMNKMEIDYRGNDPLPYLRMIVIEVFENNRWGPTVFDELITGI